MYNLRSKPSSVNPVVSLNHTDQSIVNLSPTFEETQRSQTRISCERTVATNLDTLKVSFWVEWNQEVFDRLESIKAIAQLGDAVSEPVELGGISFNCRRSGVTHFPFYLNRGDVTVMINRRKFDGPMPTMILEIGSISCWSPGFLLTYIEILRMVDSVGGIIHSEKISEVHLATDIIGLNLAEYPFNNQDYWISKAHDFAPFYKYRKLTGISLGKGRLMLRVYDKVKELIKQSSKQELFKDVWGLKKYNEKPVTRIEFQVRRPVLRDMKPEINTLIELTDRLASIWDYCTSDWCRFVANPVDRNHHQSRAELHPIWKFIQSVPSWEGRLSLVRHKKYSTKDIEVIRNIFRGTGMSFVAATGEEIDPNDLESVIDAAKHLIEISLRDFASRKGEFEKAMKIKINAARGPLNSISEQPI